MMEHGDSILSNHTIGKKKKCLLSYCHFFFFFFCSLFYRVAHPGLVPIAKAVFDEGMKAPNQIDYIPQEGKDITAQDLLMIPEGTISLEVFIFNKYFFLFY